MSGLFSAVRKYFKPKGLVGYDLQGNKYFEIPNPAGGRMKRFVEYKKTRDLSEYSRDELKPPVQWRAWLSHTRVEAPTLPELQHDTARRTDLQPKILAIEAREREERIRQGYLLPDGTPAGVASGSMIAGPSTPSERRARLESIGQGAGATQKQNQNQHQSERRSGGVQWQSSSQPQTQTQTQTQLHSQTQTHAQPRNAFNSEQSASSNEYPVPSPIRSDLPPPRETIDPALHSSAEELRRLAMEDTKRRMGFTGSENNSASASAGGTSIDPRSQVQPQPRPKARGQAASTGSQQQSSSVTPPAAEGGGALKPRRRGGI